MAQDLQQVRLNHRRGWWWTPVPGTSHSTASMLPLSAMHLIVRKLIFFCWIRLDTIYDQWFYASYNMANSQPMQGWHGTIPFEFTQTLYHRTKGGRKGIDDGYSGISSLSLLGSFESKPCSALLIRCWIRNLLTYNIHKSTRQKCFKRVRRCNLYGKSWKVLFRRASAPSYHVVKNSSHPPSLSFRGVAQKCNHLAGNVRGLVAGH